MQEFSRSFQQAIKTSLIIHPMMEILDSWPTSFT